MLRRVAYPDTESMERHVEAVGDRDLGGFEHGQAVMAFVFGQQGEGIIDTLDGYVCAPKGGGPATFLPNIPLPRESVYATSHPISMDILAAWTGGGALRFMNLGFVQMNALDPQ